MLHDELQLSTHLDITTLFFLQVIDYANSVHAKWEIRSKLHKSQVVANAGHHVDLVD